MSTNFYSGKEYTAAGVPYQHDVFERFVSQLDRRITMSSVHRNLSRLKRVFSHSPQRKCTGASETSTSVTAINREYITTRNITTTGNFFSPQPQRGVSSHTPLLVYAVDPARCSFENQTTHSSENQTTHFVLSSAGRGPPRRTFSSDALPASADLNLRSSTEREHDARAGPSDAPVDEDHSEQQSSASDEAGTTKPRAPETVLSMRAPDEQVEIPGDLGSEKPPVGSSATSPFQSLNLQFGRAAAEAEESLHRIRKASSVFQRRRSK